MNAQAPNASASFAILDDLVRLVLRAFYTDEHILCAEVLLRVHRPISDEEVGQILKLNYRLVRKALSKLKEDHLVRSIDQKSKDPKNKEKKEKKKKDMYNNEEKAKKWQQLTFWYMDYKHFVDIVKYRIYMMTKKLDEEVDKQLQIQNYFCPRCSKKFTAFDAERLFNMTTQTLHCDRCKSELNEQDNTIQVNEAQQKQSSMLKQLRPITEQLKKTEGIIIPAIELKLVKPEENADGKPSSAPKMGSFMYEPQIVIDFGDASSKNNAPSGTGLIAPASVPGKPAIGPGGTGPLPQGPTVVVEKKEKKKEAVPWLVSQQAKKEEEAVVAPVQAPVVPTGPKEEDKSYAESYLRSLQNNNNAAAAAPQVVQPTVEVEMTHAAPETQAEPEAEPEAEAEAEAEVDDQHAEITVKVGDRDVPISEVSEEDQAQMTPDEYQAYYEKLQALGYVD